jgi:ABC-type transport system involved in cytochrome bd biosynthesis fused ATPase/permease subunit
LPTRLSTLRKADRLVVMDRGEIVELGGHDELIAEAGTTTGACGRRRRGAWTSRKTTPAGMG